MVRLAEQQGHIVAQVMRAVLDHLNLTEEQKAIAPAGVREELMAVASQDVVGAV
jgi:hypothetical protein